MGTINCDIEGLTNKVQPSLNSGKNDLDLATNIISSIIIPSDFDYYYEVKRIPEKISSIKDELIDINNWILGVVNKFENAERENENILRNLLEFFTGGLIKTDTVTVQMPLGNNEIMPDNFTKAIDPETKYVSGYFFTNTGKMLTAIQQTLISGWGGKCNRAATSMVLSMYSDKPIEEIVDDLNQFHDVTIPSNKFFNEYGLTRSGYLKPTQIEQEKLQAVLEYSVQSGESCLVWVKGTNVVGESGKVWTKVEHWVAVVDYRVSNGHAEIAIADSDGTKKDVAGTKTFEAVDWYPVTEFDGKISNLVVVAENQEVINKVEQLTGLK